MRVVLLGDSHLARLGRPLPLLGPDVVNAAVGGAVATDVPAQAFAVPVLPDDVAVLSVGTNDGMPGYAVTPGSMASALVDLVDRVHPARWVYVVPPLPESGEHGEAARAVLATTGVLAVVDAPALLAPLGARAFLEDGLHLTAAAYDVVLPAIAAAVAQP